MAAACASEGPGELLGWWWFHMISPDGVAKVAAACASEGPGGWTACLPYLGWCSYYVLAQHRELPLHEASHMRQCPQSGQLVWTHMPVQRKCSVSVSARAQLNSWVSACMQRMRTRASHAPHTWSTAGCPPGGYEGSVLIIHGSNGPPSVGDVSGTAFTYMPPLQVGPPRRTV